VNKDFHIYIIVAYRGAPVLRMRGALHHEYGMCRIVFYVILLYFVRIIFFNLPTSVPEFLSSETKQRDMHSRRKKCPGAKHTVIKNHKRLSSTIDS